jgi:hypothetical protein
MENWTMPEIPLKKAEWVRATEFKPKESGSYLCIREYVDDLFGLEKEMLVCHFNVDMQKFVAMSQEQNVTYWLPVPEFPEHTWNSTLISREEMQRQISEGKLTLLVHVTEVTPDYRGLIQEALKHFPSNESIFYSSTRNKHIEDYMYAIKNSKYE